MNKNGEEKKGRGRPPLWKDPIELKELVLDYFQSEEGQNKPTFAGLAYFIGIDRKTLFNYSKKDEFFPTIKKARDRIELFYEQKLMFDDGPKTGVIFALKNWGWSDNSKIDHTTDGEKMSVTGFTMKPLEEDGNTTRSNDKTA
jgi:hypothetical protein